MAFTAISTGDIDVGDPVTATLMDLVRTNLDDLDTRTSTLEAGVGKIEIFQGPVIIGSPSSGTLTGISYYQAPAALTLISAIITIFEVGSLTGDLEIDLQKSTDYDSANFATVFSTKPKVALGSASDYDTSAAHTAAVFSTTSVSLNNILRLDVTALPTGMGKFNIFIFGEST